MSSHEILETDAKNMYRSAVVQKAKCGNLRNFLLLRFYAKSIVSNLESEKLPS